MEISPFYDKKVACIYCKQNFTTTKIRSRFIRVSSHESDFKPVYSNPEVNPIFYNVAVCPHCGFSSTDDFSSYFAPGTEEDIAARITSQWNGRSFSAARDINEAIETYKLAYLSAMFKKENVLTLAGLTLRIAWLYRDKGAEVEEQRFLTIARNFYTTAFSEGDFTGTQMSETRVLYLIAELSWKIGDENEAIKSFSRILERQRTSSEPKLIEMTKERWQDIRAIK
ncbi:MULTISPECIES: DUF2225 domain-containing protein [Sporosarcina]|uniref:Uncharacterized protein (DUF2225 family) n=1 Tax=Sporosarcina psychrophila TaxID=1476 RepID=A0ABV2KHB0_SPOPS|nr:DUF2225 domain-containing protein [Sporosarcina sp. resist]QNK89192.1 DUF2225 domain-containing protein [Sporosarcina sp. resist]